MTNEIINYVARIGGILIGIVDYVVWLGRLTVLTTMSYSDLRRRVVLDRDIAWFAFFNMLPLLLSETYPDDLSWPPFVFTLARNTVSTGRTVPLLFSLPLWIAQLLFLALSMGGALFLLFVSFILRRMSSHATIGTGDILFVLAAGLGCDYAMSLRMVLLAFVLAMPAAVIIRCARRGQENIAFVPFLALAFLCLKLF